MKKGFIKNEELLEEKVSDTDYLDFSESIETLSGKIGVNKKSNIIGVVGSFGVGKSTLISKVKDIHLERMRSGYILTHGNFLKEKNYGKV